MSGRPAILMTAREFRRACGHFLTGVTIVTARAPDGSPVGITANSFTAVSLEPPLVLICVDGKSGTYPAFAVGAPYAVQVLRHDQRELSTRFATRGTDKFAGVAWREGLGGVPILPAFATLFECVTVTAQTVGDHGLFVGSVERVDVRDTDDPLGFYRGAYVRVAREGAERVPEEAAELWRLGWA